MTVERTALKHFLEAADSLQIKGLSNLSRPSVATPQVSSSSGGRSGAATDLTSKNRTAATPAVAEKLSRGDAQEQGDRSAMKHEAVNSMHSRAAVAEHCGDGAVVEDKNNSPAGRLPISIPDGSGETRLGGGREPVQMVRIVKKRSLLPAASPKAASPKAAKKLKRPDQTPCEGRYPELL